MTYNVFGGTLNLTQPTCSAELHSCAPVTVQCTSCHLAYIIIAIYNSSKQPVMISWQHTNISIFCDDLLTQ